MEKIEVARPKRLALHSLDSFPEIFYFDVCFFTFLYQR